MKKEKYIPISKRSRKEQHRFYSSLRENWNGIVPITRLIPNKKKTKEGKLTIVERAEITRT